MRRIYIAGPISKGPLADNVQQATDAFHRLLRAGFAPFCPHWSVYAGGTRTTPSGTIYAIAQAQAGGTTNDDWLGMDLEWVRVSEAVVRLPGVSVGADLEVAEARRVGIPVFDSIDAAIRWGAA